MKIRVTQHSGRVKGSSAKHNDRNFDTSIAPHIDDERTSENKTFQWVKNDNSFEENELLFYEENFGDAIRARNEKYIKSGHPESVRSVQEIYKNNLKKPEEIILQIGNKDNFQDKKIFVDCVNEYTMYLKRWSKEHGNPFTFLNGAIHFDEASPHAHLKRVWHYKNDDGLLEVGQNKALEKAGVELPDPSKKTGRYNNRKMVFDAMARKKWIEICKSHGLEIEEEPQIGVKHLEKEDFIRQKIESDRLHAEKMIERAEERTKEAEKSVRKANIQRVVNLEQAAEAEEKAKKAEKRAESAEQRETEAEKQTIDAINMMETAEKRTKKLNSKEKKLSAEIEKLEIQKESLESILEFTKETITNAQTQLKGLAEKSDANPHANLPDFLQKKIQETSEKTVKYWQDFADDTHRCCAAVYHRAKGNTMERRKIAGQAVLPYIQQFRDVSTESKLDTYVSEVVKASGSRFDLRKSYRDMRDEGRHTPNYFHPFYTDYTKPQQTKDVPIPSLKLESKAQEQDDWNSLSETEKAEIRNRPDSFTR